MGLDAVYLKTLYIKAFGAVAERRMEFAASPGLHLIYGPNEAGKSTMLRAVFGLLYGIDVRTRDAHRFQYPELRIGGVLVGQDGTTLAVMRRKAQKGSLRAWDPKSGEELSAVIDDAALAGFTGGLDEHMYRAAYGLDHDCLVAGGRELREGKGAAGETLFQAGAGLASAGRLAKTLKEQADALFRPRASTAVINQHSSELEALQKEAAKLALRPTDWAERVKTLESAKTQLGAVNKQQSELRRRTHELEHLSALLPLVTKLKEHRGKVAVLRSLLNVSPETVRPVRLQIESRRRDAQTAEERAQRQLVDAERELGELPPPDEVLTEAEEIKRLGALVERYAQDRLRQADLEAERAQAGIAASDAASQIAPGVALAELLDRRPDAQLVERVNALAGRMTESQANLKSAVELCDDAESELRTEHKRLEDLAASVDAMPLEACLQRIELEGDQEIAAEQRRGELKAARDNVERMAARLGGTVQDLIRQGVPTIAQIDEAAALVEQSANAVSNLKTEVEALVADRTPLANQLAEWEQQGMPVSREALLDARAQREQAWQPLKSAALAGTAAPPAAIAPFEQTIANADKVADDRFQDAERATRADSHRLRIAQINERLEQQRRAAVAASEALADAESRWNELTAGMGVAPVTPAAARAWLNQHGKLCEAEAACQQEEAVVSLTDRRAAEQRSAISGALESLGAPSIAQRESMATALQRARLLSKRIDAQNKQRAQLTENITRLESRVEQRRKAKARAESDLQLTRELWVAAMQRLGLQPDALAAEAQAQLQRWSTLNTAIATKVSKETEITATKRVIQNFEERAAPIVNKFAPGVPLDTGIESLLGRVNKAEETERLREQASQNVRGKFKALSEAKETLRGLIEQFDGLLRDHLCDSADALIEAETRGDELAKASAAVGLLEEQIRSQGRGADDAIALCEGKDPVEIKAQLEETKTRQEQLADELSGAIAAEQEARRAVVQADGNDLAASKTQDAAEVMAQLTEEAYEYASLRVASQLMGRVIESYRREHQGPVVARASELFSTITGGRFKWLMADSDEGREILLAVRKNDRRMRFDELSDGRRDQLFLALRIASIEERLAHVEPLPLLVDDAAINFDDQAMTATLKALAELGNRTQVLFFTHHPHAISLAKENLEPSRFVLHELTDAWAPAIAPQLT